MTDELMTSAAPDIASMTLELPRKRARVRFAVAFMIGLIAALAIGSGALYALDRHYTGKILPGVSVGGINVSGLSPDEARSRLTEAFASYGEGRAVLTGDGKQAVIEYATIGRRPDVEAMVVEAMNVGRAGNPIERVIYDARTAVRGVELQPRVTFDVARLERLVKIYAARLRIAPKDAAVVPVTGGFRVVDGVAGQEAERAGPSDFLTAALARTDAPSEIKLDFELSASEPDVTTAEAQEAMAAAKRIALDIEIVEGKEAWKIPAKTVRSWISFATTDSRYEPIVASSALQTALTKIAKKVARQAQNASFTLSGQKITGVTAARNGRALDIPATAARVSELLRTRAAGGITTEIEPALTITTPALTTEAAKAVQSKMKLISKWTTYFPITERNGFGANIWIPAMDIDGYVVGAGETFDFWKAVGPVTREHGYRTGGAIINGRSEPQGALAGGICSCSTTLFNAALRAGYKMGARRNHYYYIDRYPLGLDATVFISASGSKQTMSWTNDTGYPVLIRGYKIRDGSAGYVRFEIYSVPTGRTVRFSKPIVRNVKPSWDTIQYTTTLPAGVRKRIEYPVTGKDVWVTRTVTDRSGRIVHQETYYSHYARITGIVLVGKGTTSTAPSPSPSPS
ncbi:MAG TPA: VanW family protein [Candidatus Limnocylindrales bacterium]|jgi:vancomycin resistance protein YoaR|nr:VanW family protein [Candidatus Limnocylindrales bacterium]